MTTHLGDPRGRACLDVARGVLIALTGCSEAQAFTAVTQAAHDHDVPVFTLAAALIATAQRHLWTRAVPRYRRNNHLGTARPDHMPGTGPTS